MFDFSQFFSADYLFDTAPQSEFVLGPILLVYFLGLAFFARLVSGWKSLNRKRKKVLLKRSWKLSYLGGLGAVLVVFRMLALPIFSMRLIGYGFFLFTVIVLIWTLLAARTEYQRKYNRKRN